MTVIDEFSVSQALIGGVLIGLSAAVLLVANGKIAGISGIAGRLLTSPNDQLWRLCFVLGLPLGAGIFWLMIGEPQIQMQTGRLGLIVGAIFVGVGTRLGAGCTSGHGVCGIGRRSLRSITATAVFMAVAAATVFITGGANP